MSAAFIKDKMKKLKILLTHRTINFNLMIALIFVAMLPATIINLFYYNQMSVSMQERVETYSREIIKQVGQKLEYLLFQTEMIKKQVIAISIASDVSGNYGEPSPKEKMLMPYKTEELMRNIIRDFKPATEVYVVESNGSHYSTNRYRDMDILMKKEWIKNMDQLTFEDMIIPTHYSDYASLNTSENNILVVSLVKKVNLRRELGITGVVQVDLKYSAIKEIIKSAVIGKAGYFVVTDASNRVIYCPDESFLGMDIQEVDYRGFNKINGDGFQQTLSIDYTLENYNWKIIGMIPIDDVFNDIRETKDISVIIILVSILFSFFLAYIISKGIVRPIGKIIKSMEKVQGGDFDIKVPDVTNRDLHVLTSSFNLMMNKIHALMKNVVEKETEKTGAQLKALQAQINPHFLYNTLEVVRSIALEHEVSSIEDITKALARMFRYSINREKEIVTISEELEHIKNYIKIQKYRYGDKFDIRFDIPQELLEYKIIRLTIQPLIENAIYHGIEMKMGKGEIIIGAYKSETSIFILVKDNGLGISEERVLEINQAFHGDESSTIRSGQSGMGIGILNVNSRLKLAYGTRFGLSVKSLPEVETVVEVHIPAIF